MAKGAGATRGRSTVRPGRFHTTGTRLVCADNTGAKELEIIEIGRASCRERV